MASELQAETGVDFLRDDAEGLLELRIVTVAASLREGSPSKDAATLFAKDLFATRAYASGREKLRTLFSFATGMRSVTCHHAPRPGGGDVQGSACPTTTGRVQVDLSELGLASALSPDRLRGKPAMRLEHSDVVEYEREVAVGAVDEGVLFDVNRTRTANDGCGIVSFAAAVTGDLPVRCECTKVYNHADVLSALQFVCNDDGATSGTLAKGDVLRAAPFVIQYVDSDADDRGRLLTETESGSGSGSGSGSDSGSGSGDGDDDAPVDYVAVGGGFAPPAAPPQVPPLPPPSPPPPPTYVYETLTLALATGSSVLFFVISVVCCFGLKRRARRARHKSRYMDDREQPVDNARRLPRACARQRQVSTPPIRPTYQEPGARPAGGGFSFSGLTTRYNPVGME